MGEEQSSLRGLRIYKACVAVQRVSRQDEGVDIGGCMWETYPSDIIVGAQLLELIERAGARRFAVYTNEDDEECNNSDGMLVSFITSGTSLGKR